MEYTGLRKLTLTENVIKYAILGGGETDYICIYAYIYIYRVVICHDIHASYIHVTSILESEGKTLVSV